MGKVVVWPKTTREEGVNDQLGPPSPRTLRHWIEMLQHPQGPPVQEGTCTGLT